MMACAERKSGQLRLPLAQPPARVHLAMPLQGLRRIGRRAVNVVVCAELPRQRLLVRAARDCDHLEAHMTRVLEGQVPRPADSQDRDKLSWLATGVAEPAERREIGAEKRRGRDRGESFRDRHQPACFGDQHLGVAAIVLYPGKLLIAAVDEITSPALIAAAATPPRNPTPTRCPMAHPSTPALSMSITPIALCLGTRGHAIGSKPATVAASLWQTPQA
jgi:hypothetical protein